MAGMDDLLRRITADLTALRARHALVGGHAVSARSEPRFTRDLDLAVAVADDRQAEALIRDLGVRGYRIVALIEEEVTRRLATVRLEHASSPAVVLDLLFATAGIEPELVATASPVTLPSGISMPVASVGHLLALKVLSMDDQRRPLDRADIIALLRVAKPEDVRTAEQAMRLITQRGSNRERDLLALFAGVQAGLA